jgi:hypothetical protein
VHPGTPLGRKHLRRNRDAPTVGLALKDLLPIVGTPGLEVKPPLDTQLTARNHIRGHSSTKGNLGNIDNYMLEKLIFIMYKLN